MFLLTKNSVAPFWAFLWCPFHQSNKPKINLGLDLLSSKEQRPTSNSKFTGRTKKLNQPTSTGASVTEKKLDYQRPATLVYCCGVLTGPYPCGVPCLDFKVITLLIHIHVLSTLSELARTSEWLMLKHTHDWWKPASQSLIPALIPKISFPSRVAPGAQEVFQKLCISWWYKFKSQTCYYVSYVVGRIMASQRWPPHTHPSPWKL